MIEKFIIRFIWAPRPESADKCIERLDRFLFELKPVLPVQRWVNVKYRKAEPQVAPIKMGILQKWILGGVHRTNFDKKIIPELGFSFTLTAGDGDLYLPIRIGCGGYGRFVNSVIIDLADGSASLKEFQRMPVILEIMKATIRCWEPDFGAVISDECSESIGSINMEYKAGWITYLSKKYEEFIDIPPSCRVENLEAGRLVMVTDDGFSSANPEHASTVIALSQQLVKYAAET